LVSSTDAVVGVLALQGAFAAHRGVLEQLGVNVAEVRTPDQLAAVDALVLPGGESTTMSLLLERAELFEPLAQRLADGLAVFGTCAGAILLASEIHDGRPDQRCFAALDVSVQRNGWGRQVDSFEAPIEVCGLDAPFRAVFIRAPRIERVGPEVEVLASVAGEPVLVRQGSIMASTFHPELSADLRLHEMFLAVAGVSSGEFPVRKVR
jgi:5'-phosphate synthase pdxT subunit